MLIRLARDIEYENYANGKGIRIVIWNQGCLVRCPGCHNKETWNLDGGNVTDVNYLKHLIVLHAKGHKGITLSGGDPFLQPDANLELAKTAHENNLDVWAYCGLTFEEILKDENKKKLVEECDVLVDGPFELDKRDITLPFKGSSNQRVIDVQKSLHKKEVVLYY